MSIEEFKEKIKLYGADGGGDRIFIVLTLLLTASLAFGLGRLSAAPVRQPITLGHFDSLPGMAASATGIGDSPGLPASAAVSDAFPQAAADSPQTRSASSVFASKSGTRYYPQGCKSGSRVSEANKIWFSSAADAEKIGLSKASGCR